MEIPPDEITISFVINHYPQKLILWLKRMYKSDMKETYPGVYYLYGLLFPIQIIAMKQLSKTENKWLSRLRTGLKVEEDLNVLAREYRQNQTDPLYSTCMDVIMRANQEHYKKEGAGMCEAIRELMFEFYGEQLEADRAKMRQEICREVRQEVCQEVRQEVRKEVCQEVFQELFKALEEDTRFLAILKQIQEKYS